MGGLIVNRHRWDEKVESMKILMIQPPRWNEKLSLAIGDQEPLGLEALAGMLPTHDITLLDMRFDGERLDPLLESFSPDVVAITGVTCELSIVSDVLSRIKRLAPETFTVVGGAHATLQPLDFQQADVDAVVLGEGEITFKELTEALERNTPLTSVKGLAVNREGTLKFTPKRAIIPDLGRVPLPDRSLTRDYRQFYARGKWQPMGSTFSTRGCPFRCSFCCNWMLADRAFRVRGLDTVIEDLHSIDEDYIFMSDDNSIHDVAYSAELCAAVQSAGIHKEYQFYGRADKIVNNTGLIEQWRKAGLRRFLIGVEHITDQRLKKVNKANTRKTNDRALQILKQLDIEIIAYFLVEPDFAPDDFERVSDYIDQMDLRDPVFSFLCAYPGTPMFEEMQPLVVDPGYDKLDMLHCPYKTTMPRQAFFEAYVNLYRRAYLGRSHAQAMTYEVDHMASIIDLLEHELLPS